MTGCLSPLLNDQRSSSRRAFAYSASMPLPRGALLWSDEFSDEKLDVRKWRLEPTASMAPPLNDELQRYVDSSNQTLQVQDGVLRLTAMSDHHGAIVSARVSTFGLFSFTYGVVEARMRVPYAKGFWPAFWMLGANVRDVGWPGCGEIDIMEVFGHRRGRRSCSTVHNPMHSWGTKDPLDGGCADLGADGQPAFHTWKLLWTPDAIAFFFDDDEETPIWMYERPDSSRGTELDADAFPYTLPEYFILNLAVGGNGPAEEYDAAALARGVHLEVDYVRVYELSSTSLHTQVATEDSSRAAKVAEQSTEELDGAGGEWRASAARVELAPSWRPQQSLGAVPSGARSAPADALKSAWTSSLAPSAPPAASSPWSPWSPLLLMMMAAVVAALSLWGARRRSKARITTAGLSVALLEEGTAAAG